MIQTIRRLLGGETNHDFRLARAELMGGNWFEARVFPSGEATQQAFAEAIALAPQRRVIEAIASARAEYLRRVSGDLEALAEARAKLHSLRSQEDIASSRLVSLKHDIDESLDRLANPALLIPQVRDAETRHADLVREISFQEIIVQRALSRIQGGLRQAITDCLQQLGDVAAEELRRADHGVAVAIAQAVAPIFAARSFSSAVQSITNNRDEVDRLAKITEADLS